MATTDTHTTPSDARTNSRVTGGCSACAHPWTAHDQIATRFCAATTAARHNRGCVCTVHPNTRTRDRFGGVDIEQAEATATEQTPAMPITTMPR